MKKSHTCTASTNVVPISRLIGDLTIFTSNFDDQSQFLIKRHAFCFSYLCLIKRYPFCVSIITSTFFLQVLSWNFMKNAQHMMCDAHGEGSMCTKNISKLKLIIDQTGGMMISPQHLNRIPTLAGTMKTIMQLAGCRGQCHWLTFDLRGNLGANKKRIVSALPRIFVWTLHHLVLAHGECYTWFP